MLRTTCLLVAASSALALAAVADEGGVEINHAGALAGIDASDPPGYPVELFNPGRYRLTGDLSPPPGIDAIQVMASDVSLDLKGHQLLGTGVPGAAGIRSWAGPAQQNVTIRDGGIRGMGDGGVMLPDVERVTLRGLRLTANGGPGFRVGHRATVEGVESVGNVACGGEAGSGSSVAKSSFTGNQQCGLRVGTASQLDRLLLNDNQASGLEFEGGGAGRDLQVARNFDVGIWLREDPNPGPGPGPGPYARPTYELTDLTVSGTGGGPGQAGLRAEDVVVKIHNGSFAGNGVGIEASGSHLTLGSVVVSDSIGPGISATLSNLQLTEVTVHGDGTTGGPGLMLSGPGGELSAEGLVVYGQQLAGVELFDVDARLVDFVVRDNGSGSGAPGVTYNGGPANVLSLRRGTLKDNGGAGLQCMPPGGTMRVLHGGIEVLGNGGGTLVDCAAIELLPSFCDPPGGGPGSC